VLLRPLPQSGIDLWQTSSIMHRHEFSMRQPAIHDAAAHGLPAIRACRSLAGQCLRSEEQQPAFSRREKYFREPMVLALSAA